MTSLEIIHRIYLLNFFGKEKFQKNYAYDCYSFNLSKN